MLFQCLTQITSLIKISRFTGLRQVITLLCLTGFACFSPNLAQAASALSAPVATAFEENFWSVSLNGKDQQESVLFLRTADKQVWAAAKDLQRWRLRLPETAAQDYQGEAFYPLDALGKSSYKVDEAKQAIAIDVAAELFLSSSYNSATASPTAIASSLGGFFNYDGSAQYNQQTLQLGVLTESGIFNSLGVGTMTMVGKNLSTAPQFIRLDSTWTTDLPASMTSLRLGDTNSQPGQWGGAVHFGGLQWASNFATQPRFVAFPSLAVAGEAALPSTVDIFVDNALKLSTEVEAGPFSITNVPMMTGQGDARIVVKDMLGREQVMIQPFYITPQLLSQGLHSYSYETGLIRQNYGRVSLDYGSPFAAGTHRYGWTDQLTGEMHTELLQRQQTLGVNGSYLYPELGVLTVSVAASHNAYGLTPLATAAFQRRLGSLSFSASTRLAGQHYTQIGAQADALAPLAVSSLSTSLNLGAYGSFNLGYIQQNNRDKVNVKLATVGYNVSLGRIGSINLSYMRSLDGLPNDSLSLNFSTSLGEQTSASLSAADQQNSQQAMLQVQQNLPRGSGFGYRVQATEGSTEKYSAAGTLQNEVGLYSAEASYARGQAAYRGTISGGVAMMGWRPRFSKRLSSSFAMVHVPGIPNVHVYADNQLAGVTDANGDILLTGLRPYQRNPISIEQADLPLDAQFKNLKTEAVPYYRSGYELSFDIKRSRGALFTLVLADGKPMPSGSLVQIVGQTETFPVALKGEVFITGLQADNSVRATWLGQSCEFSVAYPEMEDPVPNLGSYTCLGVKP